MPRNPPTRRLAVALLLLVALASATAAATTVRLTGPTQLPADEVAALIGDANATDDVEAWALAARARVELRYARAGYLSVRTWHRYDADEDVLAIHVDEGRMTHLLVKGVNLLDALIYRADMDLPGNIHHAPTVERILQTLRARHDLAFISARVEPLDAYAATPIGRYVQQRALVFTVLRPEAFGWRFRFDVDARWGATPKLSVHYEGLALEDDELEASAWLAAPFRRIVTQQKTEAQWVYGRIGVNYHFPHLAGSLIRPGVKALATYARHGRDDADVTDYLHLVTGGMATVGLAWDATEIDLGLGAAFHRIDGDDEDGAEVGFEATRVLGELHGRQILGPRRRLMENPDTAEVVLRLGHDVVGGTVYELRAQADLTLPVGPLSIELRPRAFWIGGGGARFFDERPITADDFMRAFLNRYVREAVQLDLLLLGYVSDTVALGGFYDVAGYRPRRTGSDRWRDAHAVGPFVRAYLLELLRLDFGYAFGFDPDLEHNFVFSLSSAF